MRLKIAKLKPVAIRAAKRASIFGIPFKPSLIDKVTQEQGKKTVKYLLQRFDFKRIFPAIAWSIVGGSEEDRERTAPHQSGNCSKLSTRSG